MPEKDILTLAKEYQERARAVVAEAGVIAAWKSIGAEINQVGSLRMGLLIKHLDIDFHIYTDRFSLADSFKAAHALAENPRVKRIWFMNGLDTDEKCVEWHAWYTDERGDEWQLDMIHIVRGSRYDGHFERVADKISARLTDKTRRAILEIKNSVPDTEKIPGIEIYKAVLNHGVTDYAGLKEWRKNNPQTGIVDIEV